MSLLELTKNNKKEAGFTLVELMVVVAIIGLLAAVAIPNFKKYQAKAKTTEAKLQLASLFLSEQSFYMDYSVYATCLNIMGYDPSTEYAQRYYVIGFKGTSAADAAAVANNAAAACNVSGGSFSGAGPVTNNSKAYFAYDAGKKVEGQLAAITFLTSIAASVVSATGSTFNASAIGIISGSNITATTADRWDIDQTKKITQVQVGY